MTELVALKKVQSESVSIASSTDTFFYRAFQRQMRSHFLKDPALVFKVGLYKKRCLNFFTNDFNIRLSMCLSIYQTLPCTLRLHSIFISFELSISYFSGFILYCSLLWFRISSRKQVNEIIAELLYNLLLCYSNLSFSYIIEKKEMFWKRIINCRSTQNL